MKTEALQESSMNNELVSVISAAIAMLSVQHRTRFVVRKITRVGDETPVWSMAGRQKLMQDRGRFSGGIR